jgi:predicted metal-dependent phosphoesterase TrpH
MAVVADLHVHTTNSDGSLTVDALAGAARRASLSAVAVTDHDRLHPALDAPVSTRDGLTVIHGIELRVEADDQRVDLLGYGVEPTAALREAYERVRARLPAS